MKKILLLLILVVPTITFAQNAWINEIHYDDPGADINEFLEVVIENPASYNLGLFKVELYNGSNGTFYDTKTIDNFTVGSSNGNFKYYTYLYPSNGIQNGSPDGIALSYNGTLIQFLSYEGAFVAVGGTADGSTSTDIGVSETNTDASGVSLQLIGPLIAGSHYTDFTWGGPTTATLGTPNPLTLPIQLTKFASKTVDKSVVLKWNTASEQNNDYFDVQRSADEKSFSSIGKVSGAGNSLVSKDYSFVDENPFAGTNYYKLVQHDFDGKTSPSNVISVATKITASQVLVYAGSSDLKVTLVSPNKTKGTLKFFDINGKKLAEKPAEINKGYNSFLLPLSLQTGIYFVNYTSESESLNVKFIK